MAAGILEVRVVSPERVVFEGEATSVVAPAWDGKVGVLPGHAPLISLLGSGELVIDVSVGTSERFHVAQGVLKVEDNQVTVLSEYAARERPPADFAGMMPPPDPDGLDHEDEDVQPDVIATPANPLV